MTLAIERHKLQDLPEAALCKKAPDAVVVLYDRAFELYGSLCLWSTKKMPKPKLADALDAAERLRREGNMSARRLAGVIEDACYAAL